MSSAESTILKSSRPFRLWDFAVSHSQLLIRSARNEEDPRSQNIDLVFTGVFFLQMPDRFGGLEVTRAESKELSRLRTMAGVPQRSGYEFFVLMSEGRASYVGAAALAIRENDLHPMQTSLGVIG